MENNRRTRMTKLLIKTALFEILEKKDISKISVKELCEEADINRTTFYLHYAQPEDVLHEAEEDALNDLMEDLKRLSPSISTKEFLIEFFRKIRIEKETYKILFSQPGVNPFVQGLKNGILNSATVLIKKTELPDYFSEFILSGNLALIKKWLDNACDISEEKMADLIYDINHRVVLQRF